MRKICTYNKHRHGSQNDQRQFPAVDKGVDQRGNENCDKHHKHSKFFTYAFLKKDINAVTSNGKASIKSMLNFTIPRFLLTPSRKKSSTGEVTNTNVDNIINNSTRQH